MLIQQTRSMTDTDGSGSGTFDLKLFDKKLDNLVWQAKMRAHGDAGISKAVGKAAKNFILKLEEDNIIHKTLITTS